MLPDLALPIPVWYLAPKTTPTSTGYTTTRVFPIPPEGDKTPHTAPTQVSHMPQVVTVKPKPTNNKKGKKTKTPSASSSKTPQPCALCETIGHPTDKCLELKRLKDLLNSPQNPVNNLTSIEKNNLPTHYKALHTNHASAICGEYRHYTHSCPKVPRYKYALVTLTQPSSPLLSIGYGSKNIFYVISEEASCSSHLTGPSTSTHGQRHPQQAHTSPSLTCALCDVSEHLINQFPELRAFNQLYPIPHITQPTRLKYRRRTCRICTNNHHMRRYPHLSQFPSNIRIPLTVFVENGNKKC